jgi:hypothetical protein
MDFRELERTFQGLWIQVEETGTRVSPLVAGQGEVDSQVVPVVERCNRGWSGKVNAVVIIEIPTSDKQHYKDFILYIDFHKTFPLYHNTQDT